MISLMSRTVKLAPALAALALTAVTLAGCTAVPPAAVQTSTTPTPSAAAAESTPMPTPTEPETCAGMSEVVSTTGGLYWERQGTLRDLGVREFARGEVAVDADGIPVTYTVEPGDVEAVVAERLCAYPNLSSMNHRRDIHPGQVLWLTPDPDSPWIPYYNPDDAPEGFQQIPYQQAIERAGAAVDAGDVDTARAIWNNTLKGMFTNQETIAAVQRVVDSGDLDALRQVSPDAIATWWSSASTTDAARRGTAAYPMSAPGARMGACPSLLRCRRSSSSSTSGSSAT